MNTTTTDKDELFRHIAKKPENIIVQEFFDYSFDSIKEIRQFVRLSKWKWKEFASLPRIEPYITAVI